MKRRPKIESKLNRVVSWAVLIPAIGLILFMFMQSVIGFLHFGESFIHAVQIGNFGDFHAQSIFWLQSVATIVILVKAYKILMSYVKRHHLSIKYLLEINFTAASLELLFNEASYSLEMKIMFLVLGLSSLIIYLIYYDKLNSIESAKHIS